MTCLFSKNKSSYFGLAIAVLMACLLWNGHTALASGKCTGTQARTWTIGSAPFCDVSASDCWDPTVNQSDSSQSISPSDCWSSSSSCWISGKHYTCGSKFAVIGTAPTCEAKSSDCTGTTPYYWTDLNCGPWGYSENPCLSGTKVLCSTIPNPYESFYWKGTAFLCGAKASDCGIDDVVAYSRCGDGSPCSSGTKILCGKNKFVQLPTTNFQTQENSKWCWLAVSVDFSLFYGKQYNSQCQLLNDLQNPPGQYNCCATPMPQQCDMTGTPETVLQWMKYSVITDQTAVPFATIESEIDQGYPLIAVIRSTAGLQHFVIVVGYKKTASSLVYFFDPANKAGVVQYMSWLDFTTNYDGKGAYNYGYITARPPP